ncbi:TetR family transcriptional regulator [Variovorax sp. UC122_21]|uniref:TetR family transcriptional regulator n=1 Tax=Variovorax sp. UC122_21 TaxID=3374554 RepID=UPI00375826E2
MKESPATDEAPLRADAARNRERILAAAEEVFLERGADASLDDVAKRAKVGDRDALSPLPDARGPACRTER